MLYWALTLLFIAAGYKIGANWAVFKKNPLKFRPESAEDDVLSWEDNWASNFMAWFSQVFIREWCDDERHWTFKIVNYLWADCSCCLSWRFFWLGATAGSAVALIILSLVGARP